MITESDAMKAVSSFCVFCKEKLISDTFDDDLKVCPLGHGYVFPHAMEYDDTSSILIEPGFLVLKRQKASPWAPDGILDNPVELKEEDILFRLLAHCPLCGETLELDLEALEIKRCPIGHGVIYVYEQENDYQVVAFEAAISILEEEAKIETSRVPIPIGYSPKDDGRIHTALHFSYIVADDPNYAYTERGCKIPNPMLFPSTGNVRYHRSLRVLEELSWVGNLYSADPNCKHYITYGRTDGVICARCPGWYTE